MALSAVFMAFLIFLMFCLAWAQLKAVLQNELQIRHEELQTVAETNPVRTAQNGVRPHRDLDGACSMGPPGTGKTTSILALAHELLGPNYKEVVLELNASDDRNIERLIQSICALVRFARLSDQEILGRLMVVVAAEKVNHGVKSPVDISMDITRLIQTLNMSTTAFRDGVKLTLEAELASTS
uniref:Replication factor C subunit 4-like n=1 Tax=Nicotiana tabacum TaxID=4097 RepID=A0A1S3XPT0_TOBAC|nr:PREDICTED: replication factor C subunit 4-like [Nicotiana tabacum]